MSRIICSPVWSTWIMSSQFRPGHEPQKSPEKGITFALGLLLVGAVMLAVWVFVQHVGMTDQFEFIRSLGN